jgi:uncharacterized protein
MSQRHLIYLHGFASSPSSSKARWMAARAEEAGWGFACPDLNQPSFDTLAVSRMLGQVDDLLGSIAPGPVTLVGSSLGAVVAVFAATRDREREEAGSRVDSIVLLAPALDLIPSLEAHFGPEKLAQWERDDRLEVFHYAEGATRDLRWGFFADARGYDACAAAVHVPTLVFQGRRDETVDARTVDAWASRRPLVTLRLLDDDHQLLGSLDAMWSGVREFLATVS